MTNRRSSKKTESIEVRVSHEIKKAFMDSCKERNRSASAVIRSFIDAFLADASRAPQHQSKKEFDMIAILRSGKMRLAGLAACAAAGVAIVTPSAAADPRLEAVFSWYDANHDNSISRDEFLASRKNGATAFNGIEIAVATKGARLRDETRAQLFERMDLTKDGKLSLKELDRAATVETILREPILRADQDGDSKVSEGELASYITARRAEAGDDNPAEGSALMAHGVITAHDGDGDGAVGVEDFRN